jgi:hypothetical protein
MAAPSRRIELSRPPALDVAPGIKNEQPRRATKARTASASNRQKQHFRKNRFPRLGPKYLSPFQTDPANSAWTPTPVNNKAIARPTYFIGFEGLTSDLRRLVYTKDISLTQAEAFT